MAVSRVTTLSRDLDVFKDLSSAQKAALGFVGIPVGTDKVDAVAQERLRSTPLDCIGDSDSESMTSSRAPSDFSTLKDLALGERMTVAPSSATTSHISSSEQTWKKEQDRQNQINLDKTKVALEDIHLHEKDPTRHRLMTLELISKAIAYSNIPLAQEIEMPFMVPKADGSKGMESSMVMCRALVHDLGNGNLAYILEPNCSKVPPIIVFRGTCPSNLATLRSSFGVRALLGVLNGFYTNIGAREVSKNKGSLIEILKYLRENHPDHKPILTGHSLGGAIAQRLMVEDGVYERVSKVVTFNSPTINRSATLKWNKLVDDGLVREEQAETISVAGDKLVNHHKYSPIGHLDSYFLGKKYRFTPDELVKGKAHSGCVLSLSGSFEVQKRSDCGRSFLKTCLVAALHIIKLPIWLVLTIMSLLIIEPLAHFAKSTDKSYRSLANRSIEVYSFAIGWDYLKKIKQLGSLVKFNPDESIRVRALNQLMRIAKNTPTKYQESDFYEGITSKEEAFKKVDELVKICATIEKELPGACDEDVVRISTYKLDVGAQMVARHAIWVERDSTYARVLYNKSVEILGEKLTNFIY
ncbi:MAG: alpha/beta hydrolase [Rhabdochlamydiaceae bacterium]|nr:alpha/beta hydrolase [Candidatus Amphrikana amoebophyrae]